MEEEPRRPPVRPRCEACRRPPATCLCARVVAVAHATPVLILQHPLEVDHAKGTGRLLHLSLRRSRLAVGERFDDESLQDWLGDDAVLLYPGESPAPAPARPGRLVVLDAPWRKSRRMLHANPRLLSLPRLALTAPPASRYASRRAHAAVQRSTLEATLFALSLLDGDDPSHERLLEHLDAEQRGWAARVDTGA